MKVDYSDLRLIEISGDSCANCIAVMPVMRDLASELGMKFEKIDVEDNPEAAKAYKIDRIPSILLADGDEVFAKCSGYQPREILEIWIQAKAEEHMKNSSDKQGEN